MYASAGKVGKVPAARCPRTGVMTRFLKSVESQKILLLVIIIVTAYKLFTPCQELF